MPKTAKYEYGDVVAFRLAKGSPVTYNGIVTGSWSNPMHKRIYTISCMNFSMNSYSVSEEYIVKKLT